MGNAGACRLCRDTGAPGEYSVAGSVCFCIGGRSPFAAAPARILQNYISVSARFEQAAYKKGAGGAEVTFNIMNRDTTPVIFVYATGDAVKIDLGVQVSVQKIRELNADFRSRCHIFPEPADRTKAEELCSIFREIYTDYLKEKEPEKEDAVLAELVKDAGKLRRKCIEKMPAYLKRGDGKA